jgi:hypothetical protein
MEDGNFLKENNISISKITYSYKFPYNYKYKERERGSKCNEARNYFLHLIHDRLLKLDDSDIILDRPNFIIELKYFYKNKYYNININSERIIFNNIDYENIGELEIIILDMIGFNLIEVGKYEYHNIVYKIDFKSCYINKIIKTFNDKNIDKLNQLYRNEYVFVQTNKRLVHVYNRINPNQIRFKINLRGRNKWIIHQNRNNGSINDLYKYRKYYWKYISLCNKQ